MFDKIIIPIVPARNQWKRDEILQLKECPYNNFTIGWLQAKEMICGVFLLISLPGAPFRGLYIFPLQKNILIWRIFIGGRNL